MKIPKIPKTFKLFGEMIKVILLDDLESKTDRIGESLYRHNEIRIQKKISNDLMEVTFWHEFVHTALGKMREYELSENEKFVNVLGQLIHQTIETMEY